MNCLEPFLRGLLALETSLMKQERLTTLLFRYVNWLTLCK